MVVCFLYFVSASYESEGTLMQVGTDAVCLPRPRSWTLTWQIAPLTLSSPFGSAAVFTWPIDQMGAHDGWDCVRNKFFLPGLNCTGGRLKAECGNIGEKVKERKVRQWALILTEWEEYPWNGTQTLDTLETDAEMHTPQGNGERVCVCVHFVDLAFF